jgi:hypothetical protein
MLQHKVSSFIRLGQNEVFDRDYYITHTNKRRFPIQVILLILLPFVGFFLVLYYSLSAVAPPDGVILLGLGGFLLPGAILLLYFGLRQLKISHGYAAITSERVIYYEFNEHPAENYQHVKTLHLKDITGVIFIIRRTLFTQSFSMVFWTEKKGISVGARGFLGFLRGCAGFTTLEPGPDALQFIQDMSGEIAARRFLPQSGSSAPSL